MDTEAWIAKAIELSTEVERLRDPVDAQQRLLDFTNAEVERLREGIDEHHEAHHDEVERLRGLRKMEAELRREARAEVEQWKALAQGQHECPHKAEVERLREENESLKRDETMGEFTQRLSDTEARLRRIEELSERWFDLTGHLFKTNPLNAALRAALEG